MRSYQIIFFRGEYSVSTENGSERRDFGLKDARNLDFQLFLSEWQAGAVVLDHGGNPLAYSSAAAFALGIAAPEPQE